MRVRIAGALALATVLVAAGACSSSDDGTEAGGTSAATGEAPATTGGSDTTGTSAPGEVPEGSTVGITDDTITISFLYSDTEPLEAAGVLPQVGDPLQDLETFVQLANEAGGAAGRQIVATNHTFPPGAAATDQRAPCIAATEDDQAFVVILLGGFAPELALCISEEHETIGYAQSGILREDVYERSQRRFFSHAMSAERLMRGWAAALADYGTLDGATLGLVRGDLGDHEAAAAALEAALQEQGYELAEQVALPCEGVSCSQYEVAVQRFQSAGVDAVFSMLGATAYPALVEAADAVGYEPQWLSSDFENQVFKTTAVFMEPVAANYDGALGFTYGIDDPEPDPYGAECNDRFAQATGVEYDWETELDQWNLVRTMCYTIDNIVAAANAAQERYGVLNQATMIEGLEGLEYQLGEVTGSWSETKHDAADSVVLERFGADCVCWTEIEGTRSTVE